VSECEPAELIPADNRRATFKPLRANVSNTDGLNKAAEPGLRRAPGAEGLLHLLPNAQKRTEKLCQAVGGRLGRSFPQGHMNETIRPYVGPKYGGLTPREREPSRDRRAGSSLTRSPATWQA
jgi:hypothetical protein